MAEQPDVACCPKCGRPVEAKDFLGNPGMVGFMRSVLPTFTCGCGYRGLPITLKLDEYMKWKSGLHK